MEWNLNGFLHDEIGLEEPKVRRVNLFRKLVRLEKTHGVAVTRIIAQCWADCCETCNRSTPSRMFCRLVKLRLIENKLWHEDRQFDGMSLEEILSSGVFKRRARMPLFEDSVQSTPRPGHHRSCERKDCKGCA